MLRFDQAVAGATSGALNFAAFMRLALYDPQVGYYRAARLRVGREPGTDFYTSSNLRAVFGALVEAATCALLGRVSPEDFTFLEIGAEPGSSVLDGVPHRFRAVQTLRLGDPLAWPENAVVFSNELFDAQPFHRLVFRQDHWRELGVCRRGDALAWTELDALSAEVDAVVARLPTHAPDGYTLDLPLAAEELARTIAAARWRGVFLAFDYGRSWSQLITDYPAGTGRAYTAHRQSGDLLANPGCQDLTCHVCWDWIEHALRDHGFVDITRESQEAFFVRRATDAVARIIGDGNDPLSPARTQLKELLHPALLGQKFEALHAVRR